MKQVFEFGCVNKVKVSLLPCSMLALLLLSGYIGNQALAAEQDAISRAFFSDRTKIAHLPVPVAGTVIDSNNAPQFAALLDPVVAQLITAGKLTITIGEMNDFPVHPAYIEATRAHWGQTSLGDEPGIINNYNAGRPFPQPLTIDDPRSGDKAAWNMRYSFMPDESEVQHFFWQYRNMRTAKVERQLAMYGSMLRFKHRHTSGQLINMPDNRADIFNALYLRVEKPQDVRNTQLLIHRQDDDTLNERAWMYSNTQRRVRRLATGQTTDAFLGSDIMIEDFLGYNGRIKDQQWTYRGSQWLLLPFYRHPPMAADKVGDDFAMTGFHGQGNCFPKVTWQLRQAHKVDAIPRDKNHPLSRRSYYLDAQGFGPALVKIYDRAERLWKLSIIGIADSNYHHPANHQWQGGIADVLSMIDLQAEHCTTIQLLPRIPEKPLSANQFSVQYLRTRGR